MKNIFLGIAIATAGLTACNTQPDNKANDTHQMGDHNMMDSSMNPSGMESDHMGMMENKNMDNVVSSYFNLKNALANDNAKEAATAGTEVATAVQQVDEAGLSPAQKKIYEEVKDDMIEHGKHIADNAGKIAHQREHFETMSKDMYDLVKVFGTNKTMYYTHCPMYNNNKGANWLSEVKEISNPYLGKKMPTCGTVKEEIR